MDKRNQASNDQAASYRREAWIRVAAFSLAALAAAAIGLGAAALITVYFPNSSRDTRNNIFSYSFAAVFAIACSTAVYIIDKALAEKFNQNP